MSDNEVNGNGKRSLSPPESLEPQGRQRSRAACAPCRQRKRKCDGKAPCGTCVRYEYNCIFASPSKQENSFDDVQSHHARASRQSNMAVDGPVENLGQQPLNHPTPGARYHHRGILDPTKMQFVRANSAVAFPRILGMDLEADRIPRLHDYAWHLGLRPQPELSTVTVVDLLLLDEVRMYAKVYFRVVRPQIGLLDEPLFEERITARYAEPGGRSDIDAVALGAVALGSFFSTDGQHPAETAFVLHAKTLLEKSMDVSPSVDDVAAWILRTVYLRLTQRPHAVWLSSMITMHQVESSGLHKEMQTIAVVYPAPSTADQRLAKIRRRLFWVARALNVIISFDFGRTRRLRSNIDVTTTKRFAPENGVFAHLLVQMAEDVPHDNGGDGETDPHSAMGAALTKIRGLNTESDFIMLVRAELAFAMYRRLWLMSLTDAKDRSDEVISIGRDGLAASRNLLDSRQPWWNVIHVPFQFICVLLAVGSPKYLSLVAPALSILHDVAQAYDTDKSRDAYSEAIALVNMARKRNEKILGALMSLPVVSPFEQQPASANASSLPDVPTSDWFSELNFEWDNFLNPALVMDNQQQSSVDQELADFVRFQ